MPPEPEVQHFALSGLLLDGLPVLGLLILSALA